MWVKGSGSDLATMGRRTSPACGCDEVLPLIEREAMSDEDMVAYLARCQLDPRCRARRSRRCCTPSSRPRTSTTRIRTGSTCSPAPPTASGWSRECFGDEAAWIPYIRPGFALRKQVGEAVARDTPG